MSHLFHTFIYGLLINGMRMAKQASAASGPREQQSW